jgi:hypothetical protein
LSKVFSSTTIVPLIDAFKLLQFARTLKRLQPKLFFLIIFQEFFLPTKTLIVFHKNVCIYSLSRHITANGIILVYTEFSSLSKSVVSAFFVRVPQV